ncbi:MAG: DUF3080 domain-containing protein [Marinobacter sp.]|nr:DUF3080 domain-containing protein [Marinobacter sp.]
MAYARRSVLLWLVVALAGCNPFGQPESLMDEYVERLGRVLETSPQLSPVASPPPLPRRRDRTLELPTPDMGMLDFLALFGCDLQFIVGERASALGRVIQPANRLRYEVRFILAAGDCLPALRAESNLYASVASARDSKLASLPLAVWNATWGVEEIESLFTRTRGYFPLDATHTTTSDLANDLAHLNRQLAALLAGELQVELDFLGAVHQRWQAKHQVGQLMKSAELLAARLNDAAQVLEGRLGDRPLCIGGRRNNRSDTLQSMFASVYVGEVQPYMAQVQRGRDALIPELVSLAELLDEVMPDGFRAYYRLYLANDDPASLWSRLDIAMARHTQAWQALLEQCGMRPGA